MAEGLQIWDAAGNLLFDSSVRILKELVSENVDSISGSIPVSLPSETTATLPLAIGEVPQETPSVTLSGGNLNYNFRSGYSNPVTIKLLLY